MIALLSVRELCRLTVGTLCLIIGVRTYAQPLDPLDFSSLGTLNLPAGDYTIDTDTLTIFDNTAPGVPLFTGVADDQNGQADYFNGVWDPVANPGQLGIPEIAVFTFAGIDLQASANVTITGTRAIALLSHGDATIGTPLSVDAEPAMAQTGPGSIGGAGGFDGGDGFPQDPSADIEDIQPGDGPGGGLPFLDVFNANTFPAGSGGFGGRGGSTAGFGGSERQGQQYGDLTAVLQGGSGGATGAFFTGGNAGGGGGGAIEINAVESLAIDAAISARGAEGISIAGTGAGGGIRLIGRDVSVDAPVVAIGGEGNGNNRPAGGGRVYLEGAVDLLGLTIGEATLGLTSQIDVNSNHLNSDGTLGTFSSLENVGVITLVPTTTLVAAGENITFGQGVPIAATTNTVNYEILVRDARLQSGATGTIGAAGYTSRDAIDLAGETATLTGPGILTNENQITGTGRVEVPTINADGGTINATLDALIFTQTVTNAMGGEINAIGSTLSFDSGLTSNGHINLINSTVNGDVVNDGVASLAGTNTFTGTVSGSGVFTGTGTGAFAGVLAPGNSPGLLTFEGDLVLESTATLEIELGGTTPGTEHDRIEVGGFATLVGELDVTLIDGFVPELGDNFGLLFASGGFDASFAALNLPDLSAQGLGWQLNPGGSTVFLEVIASLPGDFDGDGEVDGADFLTWQRDTSVGDLANWQANYGGPSSLAASSTAVPEPTTLLLFALAGVSGLVVSHRR